MGYYMAGGLLDTLENLLGGPKGSPASEAITKGGNTAISALQRAVNPVGSIASALAGGHRKRRRMHVTNVKALHRAMRRVKGFAHLARQTMTFTQHHKMKGRRRRR